MLEVVSRNAVSLTANPSVEIATVMSFVLFMATAVKMLRSLDVILGGKLQ